MRFLLLFCLFFRLRFVALKESLFCCPMLFLESFLSRITVTVNFQKDTYNAGKKYRDK